MKVVIIYVPVLHRGYEEFLLRHRDASLVLIFGPGTISEFEWLKKDLRCMTPFRAVDAIRSWNIFPKVCYLEDFQLDRLSRANIVMPDEIECRMLAETKFVGFSVSFESVKLRYDKKKTESTEEINAVVVTDSEAISMMGIAESVRLHSPDWWLQVGAIVARNREVLLTGWNEHYPSEREALFMGDPRSNYKRGINLELSLADHAESVVVGEAARRGISLEGTDFYVTTFPCPPCSKLVSRTGIRRLFFHRGYAVLDGDSSLRRKGVEIFRVKS